MSSLTSTNPATLETVGEISTTALAELPALIERAQIAQLDWGDHSVRERGQHLLRAREYLLDHLDTLADLIHEENGKPRCEALSAELFPVADLLHYYGSHAQSLLRPHTLSTGIMRLLQRHSRMHYLPLGTVGVIAPWNYPFAIPAGTIAMALVAGNAVLFKSSELTPLVGQALTEMFQAVLPPDILTHVVGAGEAGHALCEAPLDKIFFTGSVATGSRVMQTCAQRVLPCQLELGGKDPMIVCADADIDIASSAAVWGAFTNAGQVCASVERCYVERPIADAFIEAVCHKTAQLRVGSDEQSDMGPLTSAQQLAHVEAQVDAARGAGACVRTGGQRWTELPGYFYEPTVLTEVQPDMAVMRDETFGPVLPIAIVDSLDDAIEQANDSPYGLTASLWTGSRDALWLDAVAQRLRAGTVTINETTYTHAICQLPWGGRGDSGFGRTHGKVGLLEMVHHHHVHRHRGHAKSFWWYPYSRELAQGFLHMTRTATRGILRATRALPHLLRLLRRDKL